MVKERTFFAQQIKNPYLITLIFFIFMMRISLAQRDAHDALIVYFWLLITASRQSRINAR